MTDPVFRQQIEALAKLAGLLHDPAQVAKDLAAQGKGDTAASVLHGLGLVDSAHSVGRATANVAKAVGRGAGKILAPMHGEGRALAGELGQLGRGVAARPNLLRMGAGALFLAPIMGGALHSTQQKSEDQLMNLQMNPDMSKISSMASLDVFLEKKAAVREKLMPAIGGSIHTSFTEGVGKGVGGGIAQAILGAIGGGIGFVHNSLIVDPKRKRLFESIVRTDPVIHDALTRSPHAQQTLGEAFETMVRFAPSLSLDLNAVRSFLREAVVGGSAGVNYATIKQLIETEKALSGTGARSHG